MERECTDPRCEEHIDHVGRPADQGRLLPRIGLGYTFAPDCSGNVGRRGFESNSMAGLDDYLDWGTSLTLTLDRVDLGLHCTDTNLGRNDCYGGSDACGARLVPSAVARF